MKPAPRHVPPRRQQRHEVRFDAAIPGVDVPSPVQDHECAGVGREQLGAEEAAGGVGDGRAVAQDAVEGGGGEEWGGGRRGGGGGGGGVGGLSGEGETRPGRGVGGGADGLEAVVDGVVAQLGEGFGEGFGAGAGETEGEDAHRAISGAVGGGLGVDEVVDGVEDGIVGHRREKKTV
ncbi:MAG: hypothetical protein Q9157_008382 [Trypethelium eluteriae]